MLNVNSKKSGSIVVLVLITCSVTLDSKIDYTLLTHWTEIHVMKNTDGNDNLPKKERKS